ncbi:MAG: DUF2127 domain-containing protein [bacterium]
MISKVEKGLRGVAVFEASKGIIVLIAGLGVLSLIHHDLQKAAEHLVARLHLIPTKHTARIFIELANDMNDTRLRLLALFAAIYSIIRFIEAYGLWFGQRWAEWFAVISGGVYIPVEIVSLSHGFSWWKIATLALNLLVVGYIGHVLLSSRKLASTANTSHQV